MNNSTLGGLIKDYRTQKGISQLDIAFALGWKEPSRLSRIEQGRTEKPTREILDKIIAAIGLSEEEKNVLLLTGGYLPTEEEILRVMEKTNKTLDEWPYPSGIFDFSWRVIYGNKHINDIFSIPLDLRGNLYKSNIRILDLLFQSDLVKGLNNDPAFFNMLLPYLKGIITVFKYEQRNRTKDKWYTEYVKKLMDIEIFRKLWSETSLKREPDVILGKFTVEKFVNPKDPKKTLKFYHFAVPVLQDPRFEVSHYVPVDLETYHYYH